MLILVVNVGSTSLKFKLYEMPAERICASGAVEGIGQPVSRYKFIGGDDAESTGEEALAGYLDAIKMIVSFLEGSGCDAIASLEDLSAVAFKTVLARGVHRAAELTEEVLAAMDEWTMLAPSHNPPYIAAIRTFREALPDIPLIGLFEPAFHQTMPEYAWRYAVPEDWVEQLGVRRYGYHGASHRYISQRVPEFLGEGATAERIISCHLGGSSSLCAIRAGRSIDTSMGFTPQSGVLHSTRPHDIDPFIPLYIMSKTGQSVDAVVRALCADSGLKALSGVSGEMRDVMNAAEDGNERACLAVDAFVYGVKKQIGAYVAALGGVDVLVFTGGIGENVPVVRERICDGLECMGIRLDAAKNKNAKPDCALESSDSGAKILALATNEELVVARAAAETLAVRSDTK